MPDETTALQEIANLLRRRVEQQDEMAKRAEENIAQFRQRSETKPIDLIREEGEQRRDEILAKMERKRRWSASEDGAQAKMERKNDLAKLEKERVQQEQRQFQERLLTELERHNSLLERLLLRLTED